MSIARGVHLEVHWYVFQRPGERQREAEVLAADFLAQAAKALQRKIELLMLHFGGQRSKQWFDNETFRGLARLRGM